MLSVSMYWIRLGRILSRYILLDIILVLLNRVFLSDIVGNPQVYHRYTNQKFSKQVV